MFSERYSLRIISKFSFRVNLILLRSKTESRVPPFSNSTSGKKIVAVTSNLSVLVSALVFGKKLNQQEMVSAVLVLFEKILSEELFF